MPVPVIEDYPDTLVHDGRPGAEQRITIDGVPVAEAAGDARPLVSIITIVFNNRKHIERAMQSVFAQSYRNIEYIVVDGGSSDGTVEAIQSHADRLSYWHSAPDKGISDAFNIGVALSRGAYVGLVNSDDWMSANQVEEGVKALQSTDAPFVFGDLVYHYPDDGSPAYRIMGDPGYAAKLWHRMPQVTHPTALVRRRIYEQHGLFDPQWKIGMDYDWLLRLHQLGIHGAHTGSVKGHMSLGGVSDARWVECLDEHRKIGVVHGGPRTILRLLNLFRIGKIHCRQLAERILPKQFAIKLRSLINRTLIET